MLICSLLCNIILAYICVALCCNFNFLNVFPVPSSSPNTIFLVVFHCRSVALSFRSPLLLRFIICCRIRSAFSDILDCNIPDRRRCPCRTIPHRLCMDSSYSASTFSFQLMLSYDFLSCFRIVRTRIFLFSFHILFGRQLFLFRVPDLYRLGTGNLYTPYVSSL